MFPELTPETSFQPRLDGLTIQHLLSSGVVAQILPKPHVQTPKIIRYLLFCGLEDQLAGRVFITNPQNGEPPATPLLTIQKTFKNNFPFGF